MKSEEPSFTEYVKSGQFEKMNAMANKLFGEEKLGLNFTWIPLEKIPFDASVLADGDVLTNEHGERIVYWEQGHYSIFTNNASDFIKHPNSTWEHKNIFE